MIAILFLFSMKQKSGIFLNIYIQPKKNKFAEPQGGSPHWQLHKKKGGGLNQSDISRNPIINPHLSSQSFARNKANTEICTTFQKLCSPYPSWYNASKTDCILQLTNIMLFWRDGGCGRINAFRRIDDLLESCHPGPWECWIFNPPPQSYLEIESIGP